MKGVILKIATFEHCNCACAESAKKVVAELRAENEKLRSAITIEPTLTPAQENELTGPKISAIFPRLEIFKMGWRTAMANAKKICDDYENEIPAARSVLDLGNGRARCDNCGEEFAQHQASNHVCDDFALPPVSPYKNHRCD